MSIVGPRPEMPFIVEEYGPMERERLRVRPGITGVWQISYFRSGAIHEKLFEPLDTMVEAALALCTTDPAQLHARIAYSLPLLIELDRPVYDLTGQTLVEGWQPEDLPKRLDEQRDALQAGQGGGYGRDRG